MTEGLSTRVCGIGMIRFLENQARWWSLLASALFFSGCTTLTEKNQVREPIHHLYTVHDPTFRRAAEALLGQAIVDGNHTETLLNGDQIFPAMLTAIRSAQRTIHLEIYIYDKGQVADLFTEALAERARAGVKVRVILDWIGSSPRDEAQRLRDAGVELEFYHPLGFYDPRRLNNRTHRKLLIVDGKVAFTGGVGIADEWRGHAEAPGHWRDNQYRVTGPVVAQLQSNFLENWIKVRHEVLHGDTVLPPLAKTGHERAQAFTSSPGLGRPTVRTMYLLAIAAAKDSILIENSYFVPDPLIVQELIEARQRGVRVRILVPGRQIDTKVTRRVSRSRWGPLLEAGVEFYEFQPTMFHCKLLVVDGFWSSVGSSNLDDRSFRINDEANMNVLDRAFAARQEAIFAADLRRSKPVSLRKWRHRPLLEKLTTPLLDTFSFEL